MLRPTDEKELAEAIAGAQDPLRITGGGTRAVGRTDGTPLTTAGITGIRLYEPGALTMVAAAGTPLAEVEDALAAEGQRLAFEPMDHRGLLGTGGEPTIGGVFAANASGPRRIQAGAARDFALGVRFVDGAGTILKNGGRVMKNVTGYDLVKLLCGSWGTLGVLTEVSFKVLPAPEARAVVLIEGLDPAQAVAAMSAALGSPFEVSGAAHTPAGVDGAPVTMLRLEGFAEQVRYRAGRLQEHLAEFGESTVELDPARTEAGWKWVRDVEGMHGAAGDVWRISVRPSDAPAVLEAIAPERALLDWGGGLIWALVPEGTDIRPRLTVPGHATLVRASAETLAKVPAFQPQPPGIARIERGLREKFDPRGIFNPGLMDS